MKILLLAAAIAPAMAQTAGIDEIMSRVALNQAKAVDQRKDWIYTQKQLLRMLRSSGKPAREEHREYAISPQANNIDKRLVSFQGTYETHGKSVAYAQPKFQYKGVDIDGELIDEMSNDMTNDHGTADGIGHDLFPLTAAEQKKYSFKLAGIEALRGRPVYHVSFEPKPGQEDGSSWKGEAWIDTAECQPVRIITRLSYRIPFAVRTFLGTDIRGLGFSVSYDRFADGVWFPVSYGGEFEVRAVFFYKRKISVSMVNSDFRHTDVTTKVAYAINEK